MPLTKPSTIKIKKHSNGVVSKVQERRVTYGSLTRVLEGLGYSRLSAKGTHIVFTHAQSNTRLILPWRADSQAVDATRLSGVYQLVASGGVASRETLRAALEQN